MLLSAGAQQMLVCKGVAIVLPAFHARAFRVLTVALKQNLFENSKGPHIIVRTPHTANLLRQPMEQEPAGLLLDISARL